MSDTNKPKLVLIILDGWGIGPKNNTNPLYSANLPVLNKIKESFPHLALQSSGLAIGLPWNEEGNSEIGHLTISAGRIVYQSVAQIDSSIDSGSFFKNPVILKAFNTAKTKGSAVCFVGLLGSGIVHSSLKHLLSLIAFAEKIDVDYKLHLFTDGRDGSPTESLILLQNVKQEKIGSISGRFYAMDRDNHINRTQSAINAMISDKSSFENPFEYLRASHDSGVTDEFVRPVCFNNKLSIKPEDSIVFFNFRKDRMKQLSKSFRELMPKTEIASFVSYEPNNGIPAAFTLDRVESPLPKVIAEQEASQLRVAESEKKAHVTYFFNGEKEEPYNNEFRIIIPSKKITSHDQSPEMRAEEITTRIIEAVEEGSYRFILGNYANLDIVAHTGNFNATIKAAEFIDKEIGLIADACLKNGTILIITADHGNAEKMINDLTGERDTKHNANPTPFIIVDNRFFRKRSAQEIEESENIVVGSLCDIAPTILKLMEIEQPTEMTGQDMTPYFQ